MITGGGMARTKGRPCMDPNDPQHASWVLLLMAVGEDGPATPPLCVHFVTGSKVRAAEKKRVNEQTALAYATSLQCPCANDREIFSEGPHRPFLWPLCLPCLHLCQ